jgi:hypothetical protein
MKHTRAHDLAAAAVLIAVIGALSPACTTPVEDESSAEPLDAVGEEEDVGVVEHAVAGCNTCASRCIEKGHGVFWCSVLCCALGCCVK